MNLIFCLFLATPQAKKACFISFGAFILCFANGSSLVALYLYRAIIAPDGIEIEVLLLFSFTTIIGNVLFTCIVDFISRKVCDGFFWVPMKKAINFQFFYVFRRYSTFFQPFLLCSACSCWRFTFVCINSILNGFVWLALWASHFLATWDYVKCRWLSAMKYFRKRYYFFLYILQINSNR